MKKNEEIIEYPIPIDNQQKCTLKALSKHSISFPAYIKPLSKRKMNKKFQNLRYCVKKCISKKRIPI